MAEPSWQPSPPPSSFQDRELRRLQALLKQETGENYTLTALRNLPVTEQAGSHLLIDAEGMIQGLIWAMSLDEETVRVLGFCVDEKLQRRGLGDEGWRSFVEAASSNGLMTVILEVREGNERARRFYRKRDLGVVGKLSKYYRDDKGLVLSGRLEA